ncbi:probable disease resistance protein At4g27220 [Prosopis cineraria]|uniref:probable disease resistance protein At4g27220 n=1 Tax=Prosopis cineraria TaxID=364024 RepID=UPI00240F3FD8|nr:probable disease resistance protein At4g27220 [Prosopis cineraria]
MEILGSVVGKIVELTMMPIAKQVGYLLFYKDNFEELEKQIEGLKTIKERIEQGVSAERKKVKEIHSDVLSWQKRVDETLEKVEKLYEEQLHHANLWCWKWSFPNLKSRHKLGRKARKMAFTIAGLKEKGRFDGGVGYDPPLVIPNVISATRGVETLDSRNMKKKEVMSSLSDPQVSKVGIYGWGGVGKTTLAKVIAKQVKNDKLFDVVAMTTISQTLDLKRVQDEIAYQLDFNLEEMTSVGRADRLCARIKKEKNILIILDDLWEKIDLEKLGIPSERDLKVGKSSLASLHVAFSQKNEIYQGCKLLLTSRHLDVLQKNDTQENFALEELNNAESWNLFEDMVGDAIKDANLQGIATQVVERCGGLPVMIVAIAKSLKYNKNIHYWKDALNNLKRVDGDKVGTVFSSFEFSYNRLKDDEMKKVFLLCGVHGPSMFFSDLLKYAIGLGVLKHTDTIEDARNRLYRIIDDLKASCLLLADDVIATDEIKMHDLVCEVAVSIASRHEYVFTSKERVQDWPSKDFLERCTYIILSQCFIQKLPDTLHCPNMKFFHLDSSNRTLEIPYSFLEGMRNLEALDLTGLNISSLSSISLVSLTKLKTLCLDQCTLNDMTGIGALINLEILSFIYSSMKEIPREMGKLTHLRMLDLRNSGIEIIPPNILPSLNKLEELYMGNASIKWEVESLTKQNKNASLAELGQLTRLTALQIQIREAWSLPSDIMFVKLERYYVVIGDKWDWSPSRGTTRLLKLKLDSNIHLEYGIKALIKRVEDLNLDEVKGISNVLFNLNSEGFPLLKHLHVQNNGEVQHIINTMARYETHVLFTKLETLLLYNLNNLVEICHGPIPVNSLGKLTVIKIKNCQQLVYLFSISMVKALSQLVEIKVSKCSSMKMIVFVENVDSDIAIDDKIEFYSMRSLSLCHLPVIEGFCSNELTASMTAKQNSLRTNVPISFFNGKLIEAL